MKQPHWNHDICSCGAVSCGTWCISGCLCSPCQLTKLHRWEERPEARLPRLLTAVFCSHVLGEKPPRVCSAVPCLLQWAFFVFPVVPFVQQVWVRAAIRDEVSELGVGRPELTRRAAAAH